MTNPIITIHNTETGEVTEREMNAEEFAQYELDKVAFANAKAEATAKAAARQALLSKLGITQEEATLLLGGN